jgi:hypothetical protein
MSCLSWRRQLAPEGEQAKSIRVNGLAGDQLGDVDTGAWHDDDPMPLDALSAPAALSEDEKPMVPSPTVRGRITTRPIRSSAFSDTGHCLAWPGDRAGS